MSIERLALVTDGPIERQDGVQRYTATVGEWMADQGIDVHYFTSGPRSGNRSHPRTHSVDVWKW